VGGDGNLLLNVGPMPDGRVEPRQVKVLEQVGAWMNVNGESIYGTRGGPWKPSAHFTSTRKGSTVYVQILSTEGNTLELPALPRNLKSASLLGSGTEVKAEVNGSNLLLHLPPGLPAPVPVIKLELDGSAMDLPALTVPAPPSAK
jgi:alpha-L-fucosidase